jgi:uncharacterized protein (DUF302 family)
MTDAYGIAVSVAVAPERAMAWVREALQAEGFGVLTEIDVQATLRQKLGEEVPPYVILGACNPALAHRALLAEPDVGLLLPCNVVVYRTPASTRVAALDPVIQLGVAANRELEPLAREARGRLSRALHAVEQRAQSSSSKGDI